jgi:hypothetical protein
MGIVLVKGPDPEQAVEHAGQLVAVHQPDLRGADGQFPVGVRPGAVKQHAAGAVHGFDGIGLFIHLGGVHVFPVVLPVAAFLPQGALENNGGLGFHVTGFPVGIAPEIQQRVPDIHALGVKKGHARRIVMES